MVDARPWLSEKLGLGFSTPPTGPLQFTFAFCTGLPNRSVTSTTKGCASSAATEPLWLSPEKIVMLTGGPGSAVAEKLTALPLDRDTARTTLGPATMARV